MAIFTRVTIDTMMVDMNFISQTLAIKLKEM